MPGGGGRPPPPPGRYWSNGGRPNGGWPRIGKPGLAPGCIGGNDCEPYGCRTGGKRGVMPSAPGKELCICIGSLMLFFRGGINSFGGNASSAKVKSSTFGDFVA